MKAAACCGAPAEFRIVRQVIHVIRCMEPTGRMAVRNTGAHLPPPDGNIRDGSQRTEDLRSAGRGNQSSDESRRWCRLG